MNLDQLSIPRGVGISKRLFVAIGAVLFLIAILFLYFLNHYAPHKKAVSSKAETVVSETTTTGAIEKIERHKYQPATQPVVVKNDQQKQQAQNIQNTQVQSQASDEAFKTAGESSVSVYQSSQITPVSNDVSVGADNAVLSSTESPEQNQLNNYAAQNGQSQKIAFLKTGNKNNDTIDSQLQHPLSPYQIMAGTIIPATLVTGIDSDLPGTITAKVNRDIFDSATGNYCLIPQGTTIIGAYDSQVSYGQSRVLIAWQRLIFPNGDSFDLNGMPGADLAGMAGLTDLVNHHYERIFGSALLMSVFGAAGQLSQPQNQNNNQMNAQQIIAGAVGQEMSRTSARLIAKNLDIQPTITIRPGDDFNVLLTRDMVLPNYYHF